MPPLDALLVLFVALAPWLTLAFMFTRALPLLSTLLAHAQATHAVGGEPAALVERKIAMEEADREARRELDRRTMALHEREAEAGRVSMPTHTHDNFEPPLIPRPFIVDPTAPFPIQE